ncbi:N6-adenosine-specific RNA methylase IME4 [Neorhizobium sp. R1-B]|uniref:Spo0J and IME4 domain-containing protein n=1 Tax=Neorhizobium sp. R1-B TaxID=2485162 RepID=UPI0010666057|nr:MT-A70 family methyltransferase [Neorhizobium sp. R1-B]TDX72614.1 N6-adenosine-specific RNA methylase IME4 [Neorhizobium sp. R1-B]
MTNSAHQLAGDRAREILEAVRRDGFYQSPSQPMTKVAMRLNIKGILDRDPKDGNRFTFTPKGRKMHGHVPVSADPAQSTMQPPNGRYPHHVLADLFPMLSDGELNELAEDIAARGQENPVWIFQGRIIDGRNREEACHRAGIVPRYCEYQGDDPLGFVLSLNLRRRHLTESQRAMVAAKIVDWERGINQVTSGSANLPTREAARRLSISERAVVSAKRIREHGSENLIRAIDSGKISVSAGAELSYLERQAQEDALRAEKKQILQRAKEIRTERMADKRAVRTSMINLTAERGKLIAGEMPRAAFPVGYADPPWEQEAWSDETGQDKGLLYPSMPLEDIKALCAGVKTPFTPDAIIFLWATSNRIDDGIGVLRDWGFEYVTIWTWDKEDMGMGRWLRDQTEHILIGKRGNFPGLLPGTQPRSLYREKKGAHSRKPVFFAQEIERLFPQMRKLELFQRRESLVTGDVRLNGKWHFWGFEAGERPTCEAAE